jgi:hypothetical protein
MNVRSKAAVLERLRTQFAAADYLVSLHAPREIEDEAISTQEIEAALAHGQVLENYPDAKRGPCCLIGGDGGQKRHIHVVVTTEHQPPIIITVYQPKPPKWASPTERGTS